MCGAVDARVAAGGWCAAVVVAGEAVVAGACVRENTSASSAVNSPPGGRGFPHCRHRHLHITHSISVD